LLITNAQKRKTTITNTGTTNIVINLIIIIFFILVSLTELYILINKEQNFTFNILIILHNYPQK